MEENLEQQCKRQVTPVCGWVGGQREGTVADEHGSSQPWTVMLFLCVPTFTNKLVILNINSNRISEHCGRTPWPRSSEGNPLFPHWDTGRSGCMKYLDCFCVWDQRAPWLLARGWQSRQDLSLTWRVPQGLIFLSASFVGTLSATARCPDAPFQAEAFLLGSGWEGVCRLTAASCMQLAESLPSSKESLFTQVCIFSLRAAWSQQLRIRLHQRRANPSAIPAQESPHRPPRPTPGLAGPCYMCMAPDPRSLTNPASLILSHVSLECSLVTFLPPGQYPVFRGVSTLSHTDSRRRSP